MPVKYFIRYVTLPIDGKFWAYSIKNNRLLDEGAIPPRGKERHWMEVDDEKEGRPVTSPDGKWTAFIKNDNVYVREVATGKEKQAESGWNVE